MIINCRSSFLLLSICFLLLQACGESNYNQGKVIYEFNCANCHMSDGTGLAKLIPPIAKSDYLASRLDKLPCIIRHGLNDTIVVNGVVYDQNMAAYPNLSESDISNVSNYIYKKWYPDYEAQNILQIRASLNNCYNFENKKR